MPMGQPIATVAAVTGTAFARDAEGKMRPLREGDVLNEGEVVVTDAGARVELTFFDGGDLAVAENRTVAVSPEASPPRSHRPIHLTRREKPLTATPVAATALAQSRSRDPS